MKTESKSKAKANEETPKFLKVGSVEIPCCASQMTLGQYVFVTEKLMNKQTSVSDFGEIFEKLGAFKREFENMDLEDELEPICREFVDNLGKNKNSIKPEEVKFELQVKNRTYRAEQTEAGAIKLNKRHFSLLETFKRKEVQNYPIHCVAIVMHDTEANEAANYSEAAVKRRVELFSEEPAMLFVGVLVELNAKLMRIVEKRKEELIEKTEEND